MLPIAGTSATAQRFAIDWVKLGDDNKTHSGDELKNESYHAEGVDALAVADGIVVAVKDSIPENVPGAQSRAVTINLETVGGNHVILDIGEGHYAFYAHLKPGSIRVKKGDRVKRGQVVGLVGNSGNSTEPHLHFHLSDSNSPLGSEGIPYALDFTVVGKCNALFSGCERGTPSQRKGEVPLANAIVQFP
jgi:murein DD-endopeptidase MepM/ murein hydrolase activator NlpD